MRSARADAGARASLRLRTKLFYMRPITTRYSLSLAAALLCCVGSTAAQTLKPYSAASASVPVAAPQWSDGDAQLLAVDASVVLPKGQQAFTLSVPTPTGGEATLTLEEAPVFSAEMQARYDDIRTYRGRDENGHAAAVTQGPSGLQVYVDDGANAYAISAVEGGNAVLRYLRDERSGFGPAESCGYTDEIAAALDAATGGLAQAGASKTAGKSLAQVEKRVYVMALASTGEFSRRRGGTVEAVNEAFAEAINILNAKLLSETALEFVLHPDNDALIFLDPGLDPYREPTLGGVLLGENTAAINERIPVETYDIGHVFTNGCRDVGGVVAGRVCNDANKARGVTCIGSSLARSVANTMTHEVAHQFAVSHSWNNCPGQDQQRAGRAAFEPGSGNTIMSYQGACPGNNIPGQSDYYHVGSLQEFRDFYVAGPGATCADVVPVANEVPVVSAPGIDGLTIPMMTPFVLEGGATDADGDELLFTWEQYDLGDAVELGTQRESTPLFRSLPPAPGGNVRYLPNREAVLQGRTDPTELLPAFGRDLTFRLTARDRRAVGGGTDWAEVQLRVDGEAGPFAVTSQPRGSVYAAGAFVTVEWDVAGTDAGDIGVAAVDILLSTDGGLTFETVLLEGTGNDGSEGVTLPADVETATARFLVRPVGNVFYAVSPSNFQIVIPTEPGFTFAPSETTTFLCLPERGQPAAAEIDFFTSGLLGFDGAIDVNIDGDLPAGIDATLTRATLTPGESTRLTVDFADYDETDSVYVELGATADGAKAARRRVLFDVVSNNFDDLALEGPANGATGVSGVPTFAFTPSARADRHVLELSPDPSFGFERVVIEDPDPSGENFGFLLETNTVYFWRVRPINRCVGDAPDIPVNAFHTFATDCITFRNEEPFLIPANSSGEFVIPVEVPESGPATDVNVPLVDIEFNSINRIDVALVNPAGTRVLLHRRRCGGNVLRSGYDDETPLELDCNVSPPTDGQLRKPVQDLSRFDGQEINGAWQLVVDIQQASSASGSFEQFELEFCADIVSQAPTLALATVPVPTGAFQFLTDEYLDADDPDTERAQLYFIIVEVPARGHVELYGRRLGVGGRFSMGNVVDGGVSYVDDGTGEGTDRMRVVLSDNAGNLIATPVVDFEIRDDAVVGVAELATVDMRLAPNPTTGVTRLRFGAPSLGGDVSVLDLQGRVLERVRVSTGATGLDLETGAYAAGVYLVTYLGEEGTQTLRLVRQ